MKGGQEDASERRLHRGLMQSGQSGVGSLRFTHRCGSASFQLRAPFNRRKWAGRWHRGDCIKEGENEAK